jgi:hypothetical protein
MHRSTVREQFTRLPVFAYNLAQVLPLSCGRQEATMGGIELMAIGNAIPGMTLSMGSALDIVAPLLAVLGVAVFGIWMARPRPRRGAALQLVHAEAR